MSGEATKSSGPVITISSGSSFWSSRVTLSRGTQGWNVRFTVDGTTYLRSHFTGRRWQGVRPWRVLEAFYRRNPVALGPREYLGDTMVEGADGIECGLLLLAATADVEDDDRERSLLAWFDGLPDPVVETIWNEEGPWTADGWRVDGCRFYEDLDAVIAHASDHRSRSVADIARKLGVPLEGNVFRLVLAELRVREEAKYGD